MKKVFLMLLGVIFVAGSASAMPINLNPDAVPTLNGKGYTQTGVFDQLGVYAHTTSTINSATTFGDKGNVMVKSLIDIDIPVSSGMNSSWWLAGGWRDINGNITATGNDYTSGTLNLYAISGIRPEFYVSDIDLNGADDDTGFIGTGDADTPGGNWVATLSLVSGSGILVPNPAYDPLDPNSRKYLSGHTDLYWQFDSILTGFWLDENGDLIDLDQLGTGEKLMAFSDMNSSQISTKGPYIYSDHDGSVSSGVVPEPATMALFGTGLLGLAGAGLRKKRA